MRHIIIADRHQLYRNAICQYLRTVSDQWDIYEASSFEQAIGRLSKERPDAFLVAEDLDGIDWALVSAQPAAVIRNDVDTAADKDSVLFYRRMTGREFYESLCNFLSGSRPVAAGGVVTPPKPHRHVINRDAFSSLTVREREVLSQLMRGASNKEIARMLNLQVVTIKLHVRGICKKLGASNRTQAALIASEGLFS